MQSEKVKSFMLVKSLLNRVGGVASWVAWVHKILAWVTWVASVNILFGVVGVGQKEGVSGVGRNFSMGRVGLRCFVKKLLLKVSQNVQESTCAGVSC